MNWVDFVIILIVFSFTLDALKRTFFVEMLDLLSFILAILLSFRFYNLPANFFESQFNIPHSLALVLGFMATWFLSETIFYFGVRFLLPTIPKSRLLHSKSLSIIPAFFRSLIFISLILILVGTFPIQPQLKLAVNESKISSFLLRYTYALEQPAKKVFGGVAEDSLSFITIRPKTTEKINLGFQTAKFEIDNVSEEAMINLVNMERTQRGLKPLKFDSGLREVARGHSEDMFKRGYFSHYSPDGESVADRADKIGVKYLVIGENLAYAPTLELAHKGLMNSQGHRENILSTDFNKVGIGVMDGGIYGKMFTQVFSN